MQVAVYKNGTQMQGLTPCPDGSFTLKNLETNQLYEFLFKYANDEALSNGVMTILHTSRCIGSKRFEV